MERGRVNTSERIHSRVLVLCCQCSKLILLLVAIALAVLFFIVVLACGGFSFSRCA